MKSIRIIWKKKYPEDTKGYLRLSTRMGNKTVTRNLPLDPIERKFYNTRTESVSKSHPEHEYYNGVIDKILKQVEKKGNKILLINDERRSFIDFMNKLIDRTSVSGTKLKYKNHRNMLLEFNKEVYNDVDVKFSDITVDFIESYRKWLKEERGNTLNTVSTKIKHFKSFVNKGVKERLYFYDVNPFSLVKNQMVETSVDILDKSDLEKLIKTKLVEVYRNKERFGQVIEDERVLEDPRYRHGYSLNDVRRFFLFQLYSQGLRVSDLITLRWNDFYIIEKNKDGEPEVRIKKRMIKTKSFIDVLINYNTLDLLRPFVPFQYLTDELKEKYVIIIHNEMELRGKRKQVVGLSQSKSYSIKMDPRRYKKFGFSFQMKGDKHFVNLPEIEEKIKIRVNEINQSVPLNDIQEYNSLVSEKLGTDEPLKYLLGIKEHLNKLIETERDELNHGSDIDLEEKYSSFFEIVKFLSTEKTTKTMFCFPILKNKDFENIDERNDFSKISDKQYSKFTGGRTYYNRLLKVVQQQCGITKKLTSHLSRHSYTSLMLQIGENIDLFDLMTSLGHKHLNTTQTYIQKFINPKIDVMNKQLSDYLNNRKK